MTQHTKTIIKDTILRERGMENLRLIRFNLRKRKSRRGLFLSVDKKIKILENLGYL